jgi:subtilisin
MARRVVQIVLSLFLALQLCAAALAVAAAEGPPARYIVVLDDAQTSADAYAPVRRSETVRVASELGIEPEQVYGTAFAGFAGHLTGRQVQRLLATGRIAAIVPDTETHLAAQTVPTGVQRIGTLANGTAKIDGVDDPMPIDIAVLDTGIDPSHPDLNVVGGFDCSGSGSWVDRHGHGTHVAGIIGARDNSTGVVGVAPGARLWAGQGLRRQRHRLCVVAYLWTGLGRLQRSDDPCGQLQWWCERYRYAQLRWNERSAPSCRLPRRAGPA